MLLALLALLVAQEASLAQGKPGESKDAAPAGTAARAGDKDDDAGDPLIAFARRWDLNHDGIYTCEEWKVFMGTVFARADKNRDNVIKGKEFEAVIASDKIFAQVSFSYFDMNGDGIISRAELVDRLNPLFARYDANGDCKVTAAELKPASAPQGSGRQGKGGEAK